MTTVLVAGLINYETTLKIDGFPLIYEPEHYPFFGINSTISGVGYNLAKAFTTLGDTVQFLSMIGKDDIGTLVLAEMGRLGIATERILPRLEKTPQSVILYDGDGKRQIHVDLKDIQQEAYPPGIFLQALEACDLAAICNINFARPFLQKARDMGKLIATDVHTIHDLDDEYNRDYMAAAHILFMSHERLPVPPRTWIQKILKRYGAEIVAVSMGNEGVLLAVRRDNFMERIPAVKTRSVVNTIGAGDAMFTSFLHFYAKDGDPYTAIQKATVFASYKIGEAGAAEGFLDEPGLENLLKTTPQPEIPQARR